ncbi:MAG TPA: calcium/sodium antiporter [Chryseolinea sp.]|nr:calcium/sodium antiporter [Chryseolinea sp.]
MYLELFLLLVGFAVLIQGTFFLVEGASSLAKIFNIPTVVIGFTIVAFGTSMPELVVTLYATQKGYHELAFANVIGSNIFNLLFVLGLSALIYPLIVLRNTIKVEIPLSLLAAIILYILVNDKVLRLHEYDQLDRTDAVILLAICSFFILYILRTLRSAGDYEETPVKLESTPVATGSILLGLALLAGGSFLVVDNVVTLAEHFALPQSFAGLTVLAIGTSLPELFTAVVAASRRNTDIVIGNVIGANIFNILFTLAVAALVRPLTYSALLNTDIEVLVLSNIILIVFMFTIHHRKLDRLEACLMIIAYLVFLLFHVVKNLQWT